MDLCLHKRSNVQSYSKFLSVFLDLDFISITHAHYFLNKDRFAGKQILLMRHDIDHSLDLALVMAEIENKFDVYASYYALPPGAYPKNINNYYGAINEQQLVHETELTSKLLSIQDMGHEVGLHNDFVQLSEVLHQKPESLFASELEYLRLNGLNIIGSSSHGSAYARDNCFQNKDIFLETISKNKCVKKNSIVFANGAKYKRFNYRKYGLIYEAYDFRSDSRIADGGGLISIAFSNGGDKKNLLEMHGDIQLDVIKNIAKNSDVFIVLIHADHWSKI